MYKDNLTRAGKTWTAEAEEKFKAPTRKQFDHESSAIYSTGSFKIEKYTHDYD